MNGRTLSVLVAMATVLAFGAFGLCGSVNYVPNGDFEAGYGHGVGSNQQDRDYTIADMWDTTQAHSGKASMKIPPGGSVVTRAIPVTPSRMYTASVWVKPVANAGKVKFTVHNISKEMGGVAPGKETATSSSAQTPMPATATMPRSTTRPAGTATASAQRRGRAVQELKPATVLEQTFDLKDGWQQIKLTGELGDFPTSDYHVKVTCMSDAVWVDQIQLEEGQLSNYKAKAPLEIGLVCDKISNIFLDTDKVSMKLLAHNAGTQALSKKVSYEVYDYLNRKVKSGSVDVSVPSGQTTQGDLDLGTGKKGIFRVVLWVDDEDGSEEEVGFPTNGGRAERLQCSPHGRRSPRWRNGSTHWSSSGRRSSWSISKATAFRKQPRASALIRPTFGNG